MSSIRPFLILAGAAAVIVSLPAAAEENHAEATAGSGESERAVLMVLLDIPADELKQELVKGIRSQTSDLILEVFFVDEAELVMQARFFSIDVASDLADAYNVAFVSFIRQNEAGKLVVYVFERSMKAMLTREAATEDSSFNVQVEAASIMVRGYLQLLAEGGHIGILPPEKEEEEKEEEKKEEKEAAEEQKGTEGKKKARPGRLFEIFLSYAMHTFSPQQSLMHGLTAGIVFSPAVFKSFSIEFNYRVFPAFSSGDENIFMTASIHPFVLGARYAHAVGRLTMSPGLAVVLEYARREVVTHAAALRELPGSEGLNVALYPSFRLSFRIGRNVDAFGQIGTTIYLRKTSYVYEFQGEEHEMLSPWQADFSLLIGLTVYGM